MTALLTFLSAAAALLFLVVVAVALVRIVDLLEEIGGSHTAYLVKLRVGLRAIATHVAHVAPAARELDAVLDRLSDKLSPPDRRPTAEPGETPSGAIR